MSASVYDRHPEAALDELQRILARDLEVPGLGGILELAVTRTPVRYRELVADPRP